jgi:hypothetical protein
MLYLLVMHPILSQTLAFPTANNHVSLPPTICLPIAHNNIPHARGENQW